MNQPHAGLYKAYNRANHTVSKTRQVVMLYDGAIRFMKQAMEAIEAKDYETRYHKLVRVSDILMGLQGCLDFDAGGSSARMLYDFYSSLDLKLFTLHRTNDLKAAEGILAELKEMRDVWDSIDRGGEEKPQPQAIAPTAPGADAVTVSA